MADGLIDARAMRCPWPALRLARAVREAQSGAAIRLVADDPKAPDEIAQLARAQGWRLTCEPQGGGWIFTVLR